MPTRHACPSWRKTAKSWKPCKKRPMAKPPPLVARPLPQALNLPMAALAASPSRPPAQRQQHLRPQLLRPPLQHPLPQQRRLPLATVVTPNIPEAEAILHRSIVTLADMEAAARDIQALGPKNVLLKGGHRTEDATDILFDGQQIVRLEAPRVATKNTHGTGCTLSSAIAANLARGMSVPEAVKAAKRYITVAIEHALPIGRGVGPTHHFYELYQKAGLSEE